MSYMFLFWDYIADIPKETDLIKVQMNYRQNSQCRQGRSRSAGDPLKFLRIQAIPQSTNQLIFPDRCWNKQQSSSLTAQLNLRRHIAYPYCPNPYSSRG